MSAEVESLRKQVAELQSQLAFQEDSIGDLDAALAQQQREILLLRRQVELLGERLRALPGEQAANPAAMEEKPPHY